MKTDMLWEDFKKKFVEIMNKNEGIKTRGITSQKNEGADEG